MESKVLFCTKECINKNAFHIKTNSISIDEVEINKTMLFDKTSYGNKGSFKYYIGYMHEVERLSPLCIKRPQLIGYANSFNNDSRYVNLLANDKKLLKKYNEIWDKIKSLSKKEFNKEPLDNDTCINTKIKIFNNVMDTEFIYKKILKDNKHCKYIPIAPKNNKCYAYLSTILLDSILVNSNNEHCPQIFLEKCLYAMNMKTLNKSFYDISLDDSIDESNN